MTFTGIPSRVLFFLAFSSKQAPTGKPLSTGKLRACAVSRVI